MSVVCSHAYSWFHQFEWNISCNLCFCSKDLANFHRPKAVWYPHHNEVAAKEQGKLAVKGSMKVILKTLGGKGSKLYVDASETVEVLKAKAAKKLGGKVIPCVSSVYHRSSRRTVLEYYQRGLVKVVGADDCRYLWSSCHRLVGLLVGIGFLHTIW